jgi:hypothetical protein
MRDTQIESAHSERLAVQHRLSWLLASARESMTVSFRVWREQTMDAAAWDQALSEVRERLCRIRTTAVFGRWQAYANHVTRWRVMRSRNMLRHGTLLKMRVWGALSKLVYMALAERTEDERAYYVSAMSSMGDDLALTTSSVESLTTELSNAGREIETLRQVETATTERNARLLARLASERRVRRADRRLAQAFCSWHGWAQDQRDWSLFARQAMTCLINGSARCCCFGTRLQAGTMPNEQSC